MTLERFAELAVSDRPLERERCAVRAQAAARLVDVAGLGRSGPGEAVLL